MRGALYLPGRDVPDPISQGESAFNDCAALIEAGTHCTSAASAIAANWPVGCGGQGCLGLALRGAVRGSLLPIQTSTFSWSSDSSNRYVTAWWDDMLFAMLRNGTLYDAQPPISW